MNNNTEAIQGVINVLQGMLDKEKGDAKAKDIRNKRCFILNALKYTCNGEVVDDIADKIECGWLSVDDFDINAEICVNSSYPELKVFILNFWVEQLKHDIGRFNDYNSICDLACLGEALASVVSLYND